MKSTLSLHSGELLSLLEAGRRERSSINLHRRLLAVHELAVQVSAAQDLHGLRQCMARSLKNWAPSSFASLCLVNGGCYERAPVIEGDASEDTEICPLNHGLVGKSLQIGKPILIGGKRGFSDSVFVECDPLEPAARSVMILPLQADGKMLGCLEIAANHPAHYTQLDCHVALLVSAHLSSALQNLLARQQLAASNERLRAQEKMLLELNERLRELALTDDLTGLFNKRRLMMQLDFEIARNRRYGGDLSCLMIDVDGFKYVNDLHGHPAGDEVLGQLGALLRSSTRITDFVARYGGDEFTVLLPQTNATGALRVAEKLRQKAREFVFHCQPGLQLHLTISLGSLTCADLSHTEASDILSLADQALYDAKRSGGDRVSAIPSTPAGSQGQEFVRPMSAA